ncbi:MAG: RNA-guided endonuclease IscB [Bacteroidales bacterium]|nr:RNA-guided endonuclease IscB [Bacteroidales bacterium]
MEKKDKQWRMVYVMSKHGKPLMPCSPSHAGQLLREGKARMARRDFFTIRLTYGSNNYRQETTLGIDTGSKHVGFSVATEKRELISGTAELRTNVVELLSDRRMLRKNRRYRKTKYRKTRFSNRTAARNDGWIAPSVRQKVDSHVRLALTITKMLPVNNVVVEAADFDIQKTKNPDIQGVEYQQGEQYGFDNVREYVFHRDNHMCQHCKGESKDKVLQVHHIESRKTGGNAPNNLITLCKTCHKAYHRGEIKLNIKRGKPFREATEMGIMKWRIVDELKKHFCNVRHTYGYITKCDRIGIGLPKEHYNDAFCITKNLKAKRLDKHHTIKFIARHSRVLHVQRPSKGGKRRSASAPYWLNNSSFTRYDKVLFNGQECFISGSSNGYACLKDINGDKVEGCKTVVTARKLKLITHRNGSMLVA